jgi:glycosyltransferase involved in cell wall biosynthesis
VHVLHAIHDFLPKHRAGSELYTLHLARAQAARHDVTVLCADYDPAREHGHVHWRMYQGVPVVEITNNWWCVSFEETYRPPLITDRIRHVLETTRPDVVHVHNLLNLSFSLPAIASGLGIPVVATLHDYTLVCASGGQRVHQREEHVCHEIETARCARCFAESPFYRQVTFARFGTDAWRGRALRRAAITAWRLWPAGAARAAGAARLVGPMTVTADDLHARLRAARDVFHAIDLFVAPSATIAAEFRRLGVPASRIRVSDYGMVPLAAVPRAVPTLPLRLGFVGTLAWHKGAHVLLEAAATLPPGSADVRIFGNVATFPDYVATLRRRSAGRPVTFMGGFAPEDAAGVYGQIDVLVVPSLWPENSPLVIHEAFQAGVPIVGARTAGIAELVTDGLNGLLYDAPGPSGLAAALRGLIEQPERLAELAAGIPPVKSLAEDVAQWDAAYTAARANGRRTA